MKGSYILIAYLKKDTPIDVGKMGRIYFEKGYYAYVGSGMGGIEKRIERHLKKEKKMRWHIDYLLEHASAPKAYYKESLEKEECAFANKLKNNFYPIKGFGSSDCDCKGHLFFIDDMSIFERIIEGLNLKLYKN